MVMCQHLFQHFDFFPLMCFLFVCLFCFTRLETFFTADILTCHSRDKTGVIMMDVWMLAQLYGLLGHLLDFSHHQSSSAFSTVTS